MRSNLTTREMEVRYVGSDLRVRFPKTHDIRPWEPDPHWAKRRTGGIAFLIPEGTRLRITRMRIKELR